MNERREDLRIRWKEVARRAGMYPQNLLRIRNGAIAVTWEAASGIDDALQWARGSVEAILAGGYPKIAGTETAAIEEPGPRGIELTLGSLQIRLPEDATADQRAALLEQVMRYYAQLMTREEFVRETKRVVDYVVQSRMDDRQGQDNDPATSTKTERDRIP